MPLCGEIWKDIPGYEGFYQVSNMGRVRSLDRYIQCSKNPAAKQPLRGRIKRFYKIGKAGYLTVGLCKLGKSKTSYVHYLVLLAFIGPCPGGMQACHFPDKNPSNNHLTNLRWDTVVNNHADKKIHGTQCMGETHGVSKLTDEAVAYIRKNYKPRKYSMKNLV